MSTSVAFAPGRISQAPGVCDPNVNLPDVFATSAPCLFASRIFPSKVLACTAACPYSL